ncbi:DUF6602 domain-containing protein [Pseudomonas aeruginosa]|uniref:DUF6602 domain-containing protein n=1 Tax=Pseudomonas aeruginosa TaxID=287 RepID=UPI0003C8B115|nr:DUF6602 domain-containing protein [Pseudomonas aeruginosa]CDH75058.1 hypothetical protein PAMH27_0633 [Pseudomonas aeruginosa MH27]
MSQWSLSQLLSSLHEDIQQRLSVVRKTFGHPGTKGDASENVWIDMLDTYLPKRYQAAKAFRVVGAELRAGQRSVSVAPSSGDFTPAQLQVLLPGDAVGPWRLQAIEGNTAVFQAGNQTRRVAIP